MSDSNDNTTPEQKGKASSGFRLQELLHGDPPDQFSGELPAEFLADAREGLERVTDNTQLDKVLRQLNKQMRVQLGAGKKRRRLPGIGNLSWSYWTVIFILLFAIIAFIAIRLMIRN